MGATVLAISVSALALSGAAARGDALRLTRVAHFTAPVYATAAPGEPGNLYVVEQAGVIRVLTAGRIRPTPFLDIRPLVLSGGEQGLLSVAFDPDYAKTRRLYVDYTDRNGDTHVVQYRSNGTVAIPASAKQLQFVKDFASNHNGGQLQFGPDGLLYWGNGDGGGGGDPQHNGQSLARPFAKIERLNVNAGGKPSWKLVAYGLRNPWRFSFDRANGDLYIGDVGQGNWEEIDYLKAGTKTIANFGWNRYEGKHSYDPSTALLSVGSYRAPVAEYSAQRGLLGQRRLRLPRHQDPVGGRPLLLRRLLLREGLELHGRGRRRSWAPHRAVHPQRPVFVRAGLGGRALPDVGRLGLALPARRLGRLARPAAAHLRALRPERRVGDRLERLVQVPQLVGDHGQLLTPLLTAVQPLQFLGDAVEAAEERLELAVGDLSVFHGT